MTDNLSDVKWVYFQYNAPSGDSRKSVYMSLNHETGKYEGEFSVSPYDATGIWKLDDITLADNEGNTYYYFNSELSGNDGDKGYNYEIKNLSQFDIVVSVSDQSPPVTSINIDSSFPKNGDWYTSNATVSLKSTDDGSGVEKTLYRVNNGDWNQYVKAIELQHEGVNTVEYKSIDKAGNEEEVKSVIVKIDNIAPTTTASSVPKNWTNQDVPIKLSAVDENSGVAKTEYKINNGEWRDYTGPINSFVEGKNVVDYRSIDNGGNVEETKSVEVKIDKTAPILDVSFDQSVLTDINQQLVPIKALVDAEDTLSGVASFELVSIVSNQPYNGKGDGNTTEDIQGAEFGTLDLDFLIRAERSSTGDRIYTVTYKAIDNAGNSVIFSQNILVKHDNSKK